MEFDTASNLSQISNQSDDIKSTISSISGLSNYQDEFADLRHLVNPDKYPVNVGQTDRDQCSTPVNDSGCDLQYEDRIADLSHQLQSTLKQNEQYKNELYNLEIKFEVKYHEKIEKLLRINNKLETEVANANEQIQRLIRNYAGKNNEPQLQINNGFISLEKRYHQLALENSNLERQVIESNKAKRELELINQKLRIDFNDFKMKIDTNHVCIKQLKDKISQQFVEMQTLTKTNNLMNQKLNEKNSEIDQIKSMLDWYKKQLNDMQIEKKGFIENISKYRSEIMSKTEIIDSLILNLKSLENKFELYQLEALKEKDLYKELKQSSVPTELKMEQNNQVMSNQPTLTYYEDSIEDLKNEIKLIKRYMAEQEEIIKKVNKENADLLSRFVATQKMLQNKNLEVEEILLIKKQLQSDIKLINEIQVKKNNEIESLKNEKLKLVTEISSCKEEKYFVDMSIKTIREQFQMFLSQYNKLKEDLFEKNKQILNLQSEKQELFMNNNWKICELEKSKNNEIQIEKLKKNIVAKDNLISEYLDKIKTLEVNLKTKEQHITNIEDNYKKEIDRYDKVLLEYKQMFENYQIKIRNLEETIRATNFLTKDLKDNLNILKSEVNRQEMEISELTNDNENLLNQIKVMNIERNLAKQDNQTETDCICLKDEETMTDLHCPQSESCSTQTEYFSEEKPHNSVGYDQRNDTEYLLEEYGSTNNRNVFNKENTVITNQINLDLNSSPDLSRVPKIDQIIQTTETQINSNIVEQSKQVNIQSKFQRLLNRVKNLEKSVLECKKNFNTLEIEKMILDKDKCELNALLQVKTREMKDQQKKYERNYRTLLRKVREHMKGRNSAEKHNKYLQDLYNNLCEENNCLKLSLSSKTYENDENKKLLMDFKNINEKMKKEVRELEKRIKLSEMCTKCVEFDVVKERLTNLETYIGDIKQEKQELEDLVMEKDNNAVDLKQTIQDFHYQMISSTTEINTYQSQVKELQICQQNSVGENENLMKELQVNQQQIEDLSNKLEVEKQLNGIKTEDIFTLKNNLRELEDKLDYVTKEKENLTMSLKVLTEELQFLKTESAKTDSLKIQHYEEQDKIVEQMKIRLQEAHRELSSVSSEKFFIQRLCNDLKVALKSYANQNQVLKERLELLSESSQDSLNSRSSLPDIPSLQSFDETLVNNLLEECRFMPAKRPLTDVQLSLDTLRKEIFILQEQISKKNLRMV